MTDYKIAAAYIRVSTEDQVELSPASQLVEIRKWASAHGYVVPNEFVFADEGISGRKVTGRDAFRRMIGIAKQKPKPFDAILLWKFSRFARNRDDAVFYKSILRKQLGIEVLSISEPMAEGKMGIITEALIEAMDEYYSINLSEEVKRGMEEKHRRGELQNTPSYGYRIENHVLVPVEPEASHVREIFRRFIAGEGLYPLARWMNEIGAHTHRGNPFENRTVEYILQNPVYIGKLRWNPSGRTRRDYHNQNIVLVYGKHEPLIDMETWEAAQKRMAEVKAVWKYHGRPIQAQKDWVSGLVRCASCGGTLIFSKPHYWKCNNYAKGRCRSSQHITDELLKEAIIRRLQMDVDSSIPFSYSVARATDGGDSELSSLTSARDAAVRKLDRLRDAYLSGADTVEEYKEAKLATRQQIENIEAQISELRRKTASVATPEAVQQKLRAALKTLVSETATIEQKHSAATSIIDHCTYDKSQNSLEIDYKFIF